ncbi:extracellular solute-binding protein [bacterium 1XD42-54]|nr:extracellular solute-binding protein [bacterium 1XD42-54]
MRHDRKVSLAMCLFLVAGCILQGMLTERQQVLAADTWEMAETTPYGRYPETVTYTLGKQVSASSGMKDGDSYEDNVYTRYLQELLNIKTELILKGDETNYSALEALAVSGGELPDVMMINDAELLSTMVAYDMVEDLTPYYETCFSNKIREIYDSYGDDRFAAVTFDGKIYGIPETDIYSSANFIWLRKDWMDELGLEAPETIDDVGRIVKAFVEQDPGNNGEGQTVGLLCDRQLMADTSKCYNVVPLFAAFGAYPGIWMEKEDGTIAYGSVLPETKAALEKLREWYQNGILDREFLLRTTNNNAKLVSEGKCGSFFGWWWAPNNPLEESVRKDPEADWQPYLLTNDEDGTVQTYLPYAADKFVVVRKGYEHPEIVMKIISALYDYARYEDSDAVAIQNYFANGIDPSATPLVINCDYSDAIFRVTEQLQSVLCGEKDSSELNTLEKGYYNACKGYLDGEKSSTNWAAYTSRITAVSLLMEHEIEYVNEGYTQGFKGIVSDEWKEYENEYMLKIIIGEYSSSAFEVMVEQWYARGGKHAQQEAQKKYERIRDGRQ